MNRRRLFSIVVPAHNATAYVRGALDSVFAQSLPAEFYEVILVDDCSTDGIVDIADAYRCNTNFIFSRTVSQSGPGIARNEGIRAACGDWIVFLDSDDRLAPAALSELKCEIERRTTAGEPLDAVGYNWAFVERSDSAEVPQRGLRKDHAYLLAGREALLERYLALQTDGSVIFTAVRREFIIENGFLFEAGVHEDVDFLFRVYRQAKGLGFIDKVLYGKVQRSASIVNTMTERHLTGFMRAWRAIGRFLADEKAVAAGRLQNAYDRGLVGVIATRVREIIRLSEPGSIPGLYRCLFKEYEATVAALGRSPDTRLGTQYGMVASAFIEGMCTPGCTDAERAAQITDAVREVLKKRWSCVDLHHSVFLGPDQIRTCCKRFFRDGEMKGDVVLIDLKGKPGRPISSDEIVSTKQRLVDALNKGEKTDCDGCPFLEYKEWGPLEPFDIRYMSLEYHSVCNLKCSYCSETYYGGMKARYDVPGLVEEFVSRGQLANCHTIVWGGGEPVVDKNFTPMIRSLVKAVPGASQRVLTNSVKYSKTLAKLLEENRVSMTTSVDAGSANTFETVRGRAMLESVMSNLKKYAALQPRRATIKYIFTELNSTMEEVRGFVALARQYELLGCSFQISSDFKQEHIGFESAFLMIAMYGLLMRDGHRAVFFDDLLRIRLGEVHAGFARQMDERLKAAGLEDSVARFEDYPRLAIWGAGLQARYMIENSAFLKAAEVAYFVDNTPSKIGTKYLGRDVLSPEVLLQDSLPIVIAAVQSYPAIFDAALAAGIEESRLVTGLVL